MFFSFLGVCSGEGLLGPMVALIGFTQQFLNQAESHLVHRKVPSKFVFVVTDLNFFVCDFLAEQFH